MSSSKRIFQISGIKDAQRKAQILRAIKQLGAIYIGGPIYKECITHLVVAQAVPSEKFLAACAGGKWIVTPEYLLDSVKLNDWLPEALYEVDLSARSPGFANPVKAWREKVARGVVSGAFQDWVVLLNVVDFKRRDIISRILKAGRAVVYVEKPVSVAITHVINRHLGENLLDRQEVLCTSMRQLALHLFGKSFARLNWPVCQPCNPSKGDLEDMDSSSENVIEETETMECTADPDLLSGLENILEDYIFNMEIWKQKSKPTYPEFQSFYLSCPASQRALEELRNVQSLLDCGFFPQALEELQAFLHPGVLPPAPLMLAILQHALDGTARPYTLRMFHTTLHNILRNNSPWDSTSYVKFFQKILQCPECKAGVWSLLNMSFRVCMTSAGTCHSLPSPACPELISFHGDLQDFILRLFQLELHAVNSGLRAVAPWSTLLGSTCWTVWERSTLSSKAVLQLAELLVEAHQWLQSCSEAVQGQRLVLRLQELVEVVVEFWCQAHSILNRPLVEKRLLELGEHIAIHCLGQGTVVPDFLLELIPSMLCSRLRLVTADALYRFVCRRNAIATGVEALSLRKIVSTYLKALGSLCARRPAADPSSQPGAEPTLTSCASQKPSSGPKGSVCVNGHGKEIVIRGINRVNAAGETLLHRACKRDQVETLLHILAHPGTDVNVKDHAGWTPLHEACNHGSSACVRALLQHSPTLDLSSQVGGVSPLHDALLNGHVLIAKMLLQYGGSSLLELRDNFGRTPLDLVPMSALREELRDCANDGDASSTAMDSGVVDVQDPALVETCSCVLVCLLLSYLQERDLAACCFSAGGSGGGSFSGDGDRGPSLHITPGQARVLPLLVPLLSVSSEAKATTATDGSSGWAGARVAQLAHDLETLLGMRQHVGTLSPALRRCQGPHTQLLVQLLEDLQAEGQLLPNAVAAL